jgi:hypothetical protein
MKANVPKVFVCQWEFSVPIDCFQNNVSWLWTSCTLLSCSYFLLPWEWRSCTSVVHWQWRSLSTGLSICNPCMYIATSMSWSNLFWPTLYRSWNNRKQHTTVYFVVCFMVMFIALSFQVNFFCRASFPQITTSCDYRLGTFITEHLADELHITPSKDNGKTWSLPKSEWLF